MQVSPLKPVPPRKLLTFDYPVNSHTTCSVLCNVPILLIKHIEENPVSGLHSLLFHQS